MSEHTAENDVHALEADRDHWKLTAERFIEQDREHNRLWAEAEERAEVTADVARAEVKAAVEEWFADVSLDDLYRTKGWSVVPPGSGVDR